MSSGIVNEGVKIKETQDEKEIKDIEYNYIARLFSKFYSRSFLNREIFYDVSKLVITFLNLSKPTSPIDIHPNGTKISFNNIDPEFQRILKLEFADAMKDFSKYFNR